MIWEWKTACACALNCKCLSIIELMEQWLKEIKGSSMTMNVIWEDIQVLMDF